ncbi:aminoglycoside 3'-O-phosphotransferase AphA16, partial [Enterobacter hormaechei]
LPNFIFENYSDLKIERDTEGWSPAEVYSVTTKKKRWFLKRSHTRYNKTTYNVRREKEIIEWAYPKFRVPQIIHYEEAKEYNSLLMNHIGGSSLEMLGPSITLEKYIDYYVQSLKLMQSINIENCPYNNCIKNRIIELEYLLENDLADINSNNWEEDTREHFRNGKDLFNYIVNNKPNEDLVFSHGDMTNSNIFIENEEVGFIDLGRCGLADKWVDIAFCVRDIREISNENKWIKMLFDKLEIVPNWDKMRYYILLDELF